MKPLIPERNKQSKQWKHYSTNFSTTMQTEILVTYGGLGDKRLVLIIVSMKAIFSLSISSLAISLDGVS